MARRRINRERAGGALPPIPVSPPAFLGMGEIAAREWRRVARLMRAHGVGTALDVAVLAAYCFAFERMVAAQEKIGADRATRVDKNGNVRRDPLVMIARGAAQDVARLASELGLSPAARLRVSYDAQSEDVMDVIERIAEEAVARDGRAQ